VAGGRSIGVIALVVAGCGGSGSPLPDGGAVDLAVAVDLGPPDLTPPVDLAGFPAFHPTMPQVRNLGGAVMPTVRVQPVFFPGDALETQAVDFLQKLAASTEWPALVAEYAVGAASVAPKIDLPAAPPAQESDADVGALLANRLDGTHPESQPSGGATLATTVYVLFYPASTALTGPFGVKSCTEFDGYHYSASVPGGAAAYVVMARCPTGNDLDQLTQLTSHELAEAATDPFPTVKPAWRGIDPRQFGWALAFGGPEIGDLCQGNTFNIFTPTDVGYSIQRCFSNARAAAYGEMCSPPQGSGPGFYAAPTSVEDVVVDNGDGTTTTVDGVNVPLGMSRTVEIGLLSAGPTAGDWMVDVLDWESAHWGRPQALQLSLDGTGGHNGGTLHLTIQPMVRPTNGTATVVIRSVLGQQKTLWPLTVGVK
jgi:hypothetical protein